MFLKLITLLSYTLANSDDCLADVLVNDAMSKVDDVIKGAKVELDKLAQYDQGHSYAENELLTDAVTLASKALGGVETWLTNEVPHVTQYANGFCTRCQDVETYFDKIKGDVEFGVDVLIPDMKSVVDAVLSKIDEAFDFACPTPVTTTAASKMLGVCMAGVMAENALKEVETMVKTYRAQLKNMTSSTNAIVSDAAAFAYNALAMADQWIAAETPTIGADACAHCQQVKNEFNMMKSMVEAAAGMVPSPEIETMLDALLAKMTAAFNFACPTPVTTTAAPKMLGVCMAGAAAEMALKEVGAVLADAKTDLKWQEMSTNPIVSDAAAFAYNALAAADKWIAAETPTIGADVCAHCQQVKKSFDNVKSILEHAADLLHCAEVTAVVNGMVGKITDAFQFACPAPASTTPKSLGNSDSCLAKNLYNDAVAKVDGVIAKAKADVQAKLSNGDFEKEAAQIIAVVLSTIEWNLNTEASEVATLVCPLCEHVAAIVSKIKLGVKMVLGLIDDTKVTTFVEGILNAVENAFMFLCPPATPKLAYWDPCTPSLCPPATTSVPAVSDSECLAEESVKTGMHDVDNLLASAKEGLKEAEGSRFIGEAAKIVYDAVDLAENWIDTMASTVEARICNRCQDVQTYFDDVKLKIEAGIAGLLNNPALEKTVDGILKKIDETFEFLCPKASLAAAAPTTTSASAPATTTVAAPMTTASAAPLATTSKTANCVSKQHASMDLNRLMQFMSTAPAHLKAFENTPVLSDAAKMLEKAFDAAYQMVSAAAPKLEALADASCLACAKLVELFDSAKGPIMKVVNTLSGDIKLFAETMLNMVDLALSSECPTNVIIQFPPLKTNAFRNVISM